MTIEDLNWYPAAIGGGFIASHRFANGKIARIKCEAIVDGVESFHLAILDRDQRVYYNKKGLDRPALNARLNTIPLLA